MPVIRARQSGAGFTSQSPIADPNAGTVDTTYNQTEVEVIHSLRTAVSAILSVMRTQGLIRSTIPYTASQSSTYSGLAGSFSTLTDGVSTTGAATNSATSEWIQADCGAVTTISSISVAGGTLPGWGGVASYLNGAVIEVSTNLSAWTTITTISDVTDSGSRTFTTPAISARYVRIRRNGWLATTEFLLS